MATETLVYRLGYEDGPFQDAISNRALSQDATIDNANAFLAPIWAITITSTNAEDTDGTNLDPFMAQYGFSRISGADEKVQDPISHWGSFETADAPSGGVTTGDLGHCTDGDFGQGAPVWFDGTDWRVTYTNAVIDSSTPTGGVAFAVVFSGGTFTGATDGDYTATQASTSGSGTGATFTVTIASNTVTAVVGVDTAGTGYAGSDTINITVTGMGGTQDTDPVLTVIGVV